MLNVTKAVLLVMLSKYAVQASYDFIGFPDVVYEPNSQVTDHASIDLDQMSIQTQLGLAQPDFLAAKKVYENGGHSKSYAVLSLNSDLTASYNKGSAVSAPSYGGDVATGKLYKDAEQGDSIIYVQYSTGDSQENYQFCQVGGLPQAEQVTSGCFASSGTMKIGINMEEYSYSYSLGDDNQNGRTIQGFSTSARDKMLTCANCPYAEYEKYFDYYGHADYADKWVMAALDGSITSFNNGNADFSKLDSIGRVEGAKKGTAYMSVYMYVIREFEDAIDDCKTGCINCNDDPVHAWDEGVAFYTGSQQAKGSGYLLYELANKRCMNFNTCGVEGALDNGIASINHRLFNLFAKGRDTLLGGKCPDVRAIVDDITALMAVPLIQGTLRYAYKLDKLNGGEKERGEGATFAAAVLPRLAFCSANDAKTVYDNMRIDGSSTSFSAVRTAFESQYACLGIGCNMVGGLLSGVGAEFYEGASPCGYLMAESPASSMSAAFPLLVSTAAVAGATLL